MTGRRLSVAVVSPRYAPDFGGLERHVEELVRGLARRGAHVEVITTDPSGRLAPLEQRDGVLVRRFPTVANDSVFFVSPQLGWWLGRHAGRYDVLHAHSYHTPLAFLAALAGLWQRVPLVLTLHYHGGGHTPLRQLLHVPYRVPGRWLIRRAARVICVSQVERELLEHDVGGGLPLEVIPNGVDAEQIAAARPHPRPPGQTLLFGVGRLEAYKQFDRLIRVLPHLPASYRSLIAGAGPERDNLAALAQRMGLQDRVQLLGRIPEDDLLGWYRSADVLLSLSLHEAFGMTLLEAAAGGAAVVASDIPAHREVAGFLPPGRALLVDPASGDAELAQALVSAAAYGRVDDTGGWALPTWRGMADRVLACYREVLGWPRVNIHEARA